MALIHCDFNSETLNLACSMCVILPQQRPASGMHPTLFLLHGLSDDHTIWQRRTSIERYVDDLGLAVVMPAVNRSFYTNMVQGPRYWDYIADEIPAVAWALFPLSDKREDTYAAGLSMGGYGAFKLALSRPHEYAAAASLSGAVDMASHGQQEDGEWSDEFTRVFGDPAKLAGSPNDLLHLAEQVAAGQMQPRLFQCCGSEDFLYQQNLNFRQHARRLELDLTYEEEPAAHVWSYWDRKIQRVLTWIFQHRA